MSLLFPWWFWIIVGAVGMFAFCLLIVATVVIWIGRSHQRSRDRELDAALGELRIVMARYDVKWEQVPESWRGEVMQLDRNVERLVDYRNHVVRQAAHCTGPRVCDGRLRLARSAHDAIGSDLV